MDLILLRHAKAEERSPALADEERSLVPKGRKKARAVARGLIDFIAPETRVEIWASHALRSSQTASIIAKELGDVPLKKIPAIYSGSLEEMIEEWRKCLSGIVVIVGHEPHLSIWVKQLTGVALPFKKCAAVGLTLRSWDTATLEWYASPKTLTAIGAAKRGG
ncbi:MAG: histidine phosphatase family protein [Negativicutes bacterium]|nr:histidine phosphatase family protein [Negativicutes bacterium]